MSVLVPLLVPALAAGLAFLLRRDAPRRALLVAAALAHAGLVARCWVELPQPAARGWLALDRPGLYFLSITSLLFLAAAVYAVGWLARDPHRPRSAMGESGSILVRAPEAVFTGCLLLFLSTMSMVAASQHFGLLWVAIEATTLASAPLIYFHRHPRSLEATWKYLLVCSVGIALALLGNFFLAVAASARATGVHTPLVLADLVAAGKSLQPAWLKAAFLLLLVGYGTKMGLAPLHTWLPDAHSEAPSPVSALLSGALLNCAFLGLLRIQQVAAAAGLAAFGQELFCVFGLVSLGVASVFIVGQADYKRLLAYSSVEHMGILALGIGLGSTFGSLLHALNHSLAKGLLFLTAGNILAAYHTKAVTEVSGVARRLPITGALWVAGLLAITGTPPFGPFLSEWTILRAAFDSGRWVVAGLYLAFLAVIFLGMTAAMLRMAQGEPGPEHAVRPGERLLAVAPPAALAILVLGLGLHLPAPLAQAIRDTAAALGGR